MDQARLRRTRIDRRGREALTGRPPPEISTDTGLLEALEPPPQLHGRIGSASSPADAIRRVSAPPRQLEPEA